MKVTVVRYGLQKDHNFYSMDISGMEEVHKKFLQDHLQTVYEYSWLVNLDDSPNPYGDHYLYVRGDPYEIDQVIGKMIKYFENDSEDNSVPKHPPVIRQPLFRAIDPDEVSKYRRFTVRESFALDYEPTMEIVKAAAAKELGIPVYFKVLTGQHLEVRLVKDQFIWTTINQEKPNGPIDEEMVAVLLDVNEKLRTNTMSPEDRFVLQTFERN